MRTSFLVLAGGLALVVTACGGGGDTAMYVSNDSHQAWYVSVPRQDHDFHYLWVVKVLPGTHDEFALAWDGGPGVAVTVLAMDCTPVGEFHDDGNNAFTVPGAPGLTGRMENHGTPFGARGETVLDTEDCGGFTFR